MARFGWQFSLGLFLVVLSVALYLVQIDIFHTPRDTLFYLFQDLAFVPVQVLLVTLIINQLLSTREKSSLIKKLNMVIGVFFDEVGTRLLGYLSNFDARSDRIQRFLAATSRWTDRDISRIKRYLRSYRYEIDYKKGDIEGLKNFLMEKRGFLLSLLENPNLLEHESFTDLLLEVFHLSDELAYRANVKQLSSAADYKHLADDIKRAYISLIYEWLDYMRHLRDNYPYLFSLAIRTNPFDRRVSPEIKG